MNSALRRASTVIAIAAVIAGMGYLYWQMFSGENVRRTWPGSASVTLSPAMLAAGKSVYVRHCASCHGARLEGQTNWRERLPSGRMPAPPHDESGHTWHHPDDVLFGIVKHGVVPGKYAPEGYQSDMPAFGAVLSDDEIRAVLAYVASQWPARVHEFRSQLRR